MSEDKSNIIIKTQAGNKGQLGIITLNRGQALNALNHEMIQFLSEILSCWQLDASIKAVVIRSNSKKAFCAGGDIRELYQNAQIKNKPVKKFFWDEYRLNQHIFHYPKPIIALLDGITMGGGVGISLHCSHPVATENMIFAMPETSIGFFPDIGASYFLPRCPGYIGIYLALTGSRLELSDLIYSQLIHNTILSEDQDILVNTIADTQFSDNPHQTITQIIDAFKKPTYSDADSHLAKIRDSIDYCFSAPTVLDIFSLLESTKNQWAIKTIESLKLKSPTSLNVTLKQMQEGKHLPFDECMRMEYRIVNRFICNVDFFEGIRAMIIDKDRKPRWNPENLQEFNAEMLAQYFAPLPDQVLEFKGYDDMVSSKP